MGAQARLVAKGGVEAPLPAMADLVAQVKEIQRADPAGKAAWGKYCEEFGGNVRDPTKHEAEYLQYFISQHEAGAYSDVAVTGPSATASGSLPELFKEGQRSSPSFKQAWSTFQTMNGGMNDPNKAGRE